MVSVLREGLASRRRPTDLANGRGWRRLVGDDIGQQRQMAGAFDFARQFALAARAIAGLAPRLNLAALVDIAG